MSSRFPRHLVLAAAMFLAAPPALAGVRVLGSPDDGPDPTYSFGDHVELSYGLALPLFSEPEVGVGWAGMIGYERVLAPQFGVVFRGEFSHMGDEGAGLRATLRSDDRADFASLGIGGRFHREVHGASAAFSEGLIGVAYSHMRAHGFRYGGFGGTPEGASSSAYGPWTETRDRWAGLFAIGLGSIYQPNNSSIGFIIETRLIAHLGDGASLHMPIRTGFVFHRPRP